MRYIENLGSRELDKFAIETAKTEYLCEMRNIESHREVFTQLPKIVDRTKKLLRKCQHSIQNFH